MSASYDQFLADKAQLDGNHGFEPIWLPEFLFPFQRSLCEWAIRKGRAAIFADCGLGKTPMELVWAENVVRKTNKRVLIMAPLAVSYQIAREGEKFGIECQVCRDGKLNGAKIVITNYERLHYFDSKDFIGAGADESGILKNFDGKTKAQITEFMRMLPYRLLGTATAAPNDYPELGTSSEALGDLGFMDMLQKFFKADNNSYAQGGRGGGRFDKNPFESKFRFRGHAERDFWRWVCSWARAIRKPSDLGFEDGSFILPPLNVRHHMVAGEIIPDGELFPIIASGLKEQRQERRGTLQGRCEMAAGLINQRKDPSIAWCNLNDEGDLLEELIPDAVQVSGADSDEQKEEAILSFIEGKVRVLVSKAKICGLGLNMQHCAHQTYFPSDSFEQWYQSIRRSWRFGQKNQVTIDVVTSKGEEKTMKNLQRKAKAAEEMFERLTSLMNNELQIHKQNPFTNKTKKPKWL